LKDYDSIYPEKVKKHDHYIVFTMNTTNKQEEENIVKNLQLLVSLILLFPKSKELKLLGLDVKISKKESLISLELGFSDKFLIEVTKGKSESYEYFKKDKKKDFGEKINATLTSGVLLTQAFTDTYEDILEKMLDISFETEGDSHIPFSINWWIEETKKDKTLEEPAKKETIKEKIYDEVIEYFNKILTFKHIDSNYCYDREFIKKVIYEYGSKSKFFEEKNEQIKDFQKNFNNVVTITNIIETLSGLFGKYLRIFKFFDFDAIDIKFYSKLKGVSIFVNLYAQDMNRFLQEKIISLFKV